MVLLVVAGMVDTRPGGNTVPGKNILFYDQMVNKVSIFQVFTVLPILTFMLLMYVSSLIGFVYKCCNGLETTTSLTEKEHMKTWRGALKAFSSEFLFNVLQRSNRFSLHRVVSISRENTASKWKD